MSGLVDLLKLEGSRIRASSGRSTSHHLLVPSTETCWESSSGSSAFLLFSLARPVPLASLVSLHLTFQGGYSASVVRLGTSHDDIIEEGEEDAEDEDEDEAIEEASQQGFVAETLEGLERGKGLRWILEAHPEDSNSEQRFSITESRPRSDAAVQSLAVHFEGGADDWGRLTLYSIAILARASANA